MDKSRVGIKASLNGSYDDLCLIWQKAEELGFDSAWVYDHFTALHNSTLPCVEAYSTLAALAAQTKRLRMGAMATCVAYRNPAYLAKILSTIDVISKGRLFAGLGAGWYQEEFKAYGYEYLPNAERVRQLRETIRIVRAMWREEKPTFKGRYYTIDGPINIPKPIQKSPPIIVGINRGTKVLPRMAVRHGDGFNTTAAPAVCGEIIAAAEEERKKIGRRRDELMYSMQAGLVIGNENQIEDAVKDEASRWQWSSRDWIESNRKRGWIIGPPESCAKRLREYADLGVDYFLLMVAGDRLGWPLELVKDELLPLL